MRYSALKFTHMSLRAGAVTGGYGCGPLGAAQRRWPVLHHPAAAHAGRRQPGQGAALCARRSYDVPLSRVLLRFCHSSPLHPASTWKCDQLTACNRYHVLLSPNAQPQLSEGVAGHLQSGGGFVVQGDGSKRAVTGVDFFIRYPTLHPFLLRQLAGAVEKLEAGDAGHPSLYPVLALLSRLRCAWRSPKPSNIALLTCLNDPLRASKAS